jgi:hypothetical protein
MSFVDSQRKNECTFLNVVHKIPFKGENLPGESIEVLTVLFSQTTWSFPIDSEIGFPSHPIALNLTFLLHKHFDEVQYIFKSAEDQQFISNFVTCFDDAL